jgi:hypothetical protein
MIRLGWILAGALLVVPMASFAADNEPNSSGTVNCGDTNTGGACIECCDGTPACSVGRIHCCPLSGECVVTNKPSGPPPLKLAVTAGGLKLQFARKITDEGVDVKLQISFLKKVFPRSLKLKAILTGGDAQISGLVFPIVFLAQGDAALGSMQTAGYDVTATGKLPKCDSLFPTELCSDLTATLSRVLYGAVGSGARQELQDFLDGVNGFGIGPCQGPIG